MSGERYTLTVDLAEKTRVDVAIPCPTCATFAYLRTDYLGPDDTECSECGAMLSLDVVSREPDDGGDA